MTLGLIGVERIPIEYYLISNIYRLQSLILFT